jgi:hypothetical protein
MPYAKVVAASRALKDKIRVLGYHVHCQKNKGTAL